MFPADSIFVMAQARTTKLMFVLAFVSIHAIALAMVTIALHRAPEGYEDELGFHLIIRSHPGCSGPTSLISAEG